MHSIHAIIRTVHECKYNQALSIGFPPAELSTEYLRVTDSRNLFIYSLNYANDLLLTAFPCFSSRSRELFRCSSWVIHRLHYLFDLCDPRRKETLASWPLFGKRCKPMRFCSSGGSVVRIPGLRSCGLARCCVCGRCSHTQGENSG